MIEFEKIADQLADVGYAIVPDFISEEEANALYHYVESLEQGFWHLAGVGREQQHTVNTHVRSDEICWLTQRTEQEMFWLDRMEQLRESVNRYLFMGLFDYECHFARYAPGSRYQKHLDAFKGRSNRVLSTILYLNPDWQPENGGELVIYGERGKVLETVLPKQGCFVVFLSDRFVHEVKVSNRLRYSLTGWFRHNTSTGFRIDPAR
ncbi:MULTISPECIES: 2OG-Fe(II) oxygenase [Gammaproteobacteria]|uniref:2OG-Fe(II) oxygenase n=1 Tax=Gammaproteobacteria TaxID=1236 RepID=UPI000DCFED70|nr:MULTISPECIES: 2OG-Fe(II) oxygenase [Gammaproteobacteria]RTE86495.1 2OG-Fe(II) oxygenase [Aliidiomarina sp. B3213]TCZ90950.1 2OG-Fe(II) oxygenase [Lysobacter sp. N42]